MRYGAWCIDDLLESWRDYVKEQGAWQVHKCEGYRPLAVDLTAFWRLRLKGWMGKYFNGLANRMVKGIGFALVSDVKVDPSAETFSIWVFFDPLYTDPERKPEQS